MKSLIQLSQNRNTTAIDAKIQAAINTIQAVIAYQTKYMNNPNLGPWIRGSTDRWSCEWLGSRAYDLRDHAKEAFELEQACLLELKELDAIKRHSFFVTLT